MKPIEALPAFPEFANINPGVAPGEPKYSQGFVPADTFPAEWANYFFNGATKGITALNAATSSIWSELQNVLCCAGIAPDSECTCQLYSALIDIIGKNNACTATTLCATRTINGTNFNGSENITTSSWGTARNIAISDCDGTNCGTAVCVDGTEAVTLTLPSTIKANLTGLASCASKDGSGCSFGTAARYACGCFLGKSGCAADSAKLGGCDASCYLLASGCAADSAKLGGCTYSQVRSGMAPLSTGSCCGATWRTVDCMVYFKATAAMKRCDVFKAFCAAMGGNLANVFPGSCACGAVGVIGVFDDCRELNYMRVYGSCITLYTDNGGTSTTYKNNDTTTGYNLMMNVLKK